MPEDEPLIREPLTGVVVASERAAELTRQLLTYAGMSPVHMEPVNLSAVVTEVQSLVRLSVPRRVELILDLPGNLPNIIADPAQIQSVVMNLVINAAEAIPLEALGTVTVSLSSEDAGRYVVLEVQDTGKGMDQATQARMFDPFFTTKFTGRGLGLAATMGAIQSHKGSISVESAPGRGTCFRLLFPATDQAVKRPQMPVTRDLRGDAAILVVDDEEVVRRTTKAALERYGYSVVVAGNGREGVDALRGAAGELSLVILDLTMPVMSGEQAIQEMRAICPEIRVILTSGYDKPKALANFRADHPVDFLQKPFSVNELGQAVYDVLSKSS